MRTGVPAYGRPLRGRFGAGIRIGVEEALTQFVDLIEDPELDRSASARIYRGLGAGEYRERRSLDALLAAYRLGARVSWRRLAETAIAAGVEPGALVVLAEAVFAYIDEISALSADGHATEQLEAAGETQRRRRRLVRLLLEPDQDRDATAAAAAEARWPEPALLAVLVWAGDGARLRGRLPGGALILEEEGGGVALIPDPQGPGAPAAIERASADILAVLGPAVAPGAAAHSADRARAVLELAELGAIDVADGRLVHSDDHLAALVTGAAPGALRDLAERRLAALADETPASRERLARTLRSWLDHQGEVARVAAELGVHPQTVRYRVNRLRDLFGPALDDPESRFELAIALRGYG